MSTNNNGTQLVGLIGWPVAHSVSPAMFNAAFAALGLNWQYEAVPTPPDDIRDTLRDLQKRGARGFNVTVPHKRGVIPFMDDIQPEAKTIGAVNTVWSVNGKHWAGTNTDIAGFKTDFLAHVEPGEKGRALILGTGGGARAATFVLARLGYQIHVASRAPNKGLELIRDVQSGLSAAARAGAGEFNSTHWRMQMLALPWERIGTVAQDMDLIVNCTPVGMWPDIDASPWPENVAIPAQAFVYDMVYRPATTRLMQQARAAGAQTANGLGMLVQQGAAAFTIWTEQDAPVDVMRQAAAQALQQDPT